MDQASAQIRRLTPRLWVTQSRLYQTNSGIFVSGNRAILIDPGIYPDEIDAIAGLLDEQGALPEWLILTHSHWDHILGPDRFKGTPTVAHVNFLTETSEESGERILRQISSWQEENGVQRASSIRLPVPDHTFSETTIVAAGRLQLKLLHAPGHAADQIIAYEPVGRVLWAADMLSDVEIPFVSHSLAAYEQTLAHLSTLEVDVLVPGHGSPTDDPGEIHVRFREDRTYLAELRSLVSPIVHQHVSMQDALDACESIVCRNPAENRQPHRMNVESVFAELGGPVTGPVGWAGES